MGRQEGADQRDQMFALVFQYIMSGVREAMDFGLGKMPLPLGQEVLIEDRVFVAPAD